MSAADRYRHVLLGLKVWDAYLLEQSHLPGPRANLELAQTVADVGVRAQFRKWSAIGSQVAPVNTPGEFLVVCGVLGYGRLLAEGDSKVLAAIRRAARDPRWRVREAAAMALQRLGDRDVGRLLAVVGPWAEGSPLEQRAAAAALCEPRLLKDPHHSASVLAILDRITASFASSPDRDGDEFTALKKGLGYCWSVAIAANPHVGRPMLERWSRSKDRQVRWVVRENLKKSRLKRADPAWVDRMLEKLA
jgi:hypothetical protein